MRTRLHESKGGGGALQSEERRGGTGTESFQNAERRSLEEEGRLFGQERGFLEKKVLGESKKSSLSTRRNQGAVEKRTKGEDLGKTKNALGERGSRRHGHREGKMGTLPGGTCDALLK